MSCRSAGDGGSSPIVEETVEPEGDEERFDELDRFRWLYLKTVLGLARAYTEIARIVSYLFFAASAVRPGK